MKKSELLKTIQNTLERCHDRYGNLYGFEVVAKEILEDIESQTENQSLLDLVEQISKVKSYSDTLRVVNIAKEYLKEMEKENEN
jgi:hypothetical protein